MTNLKSMISLACSQDAKIELLGGIQAEIQTAISLVKEYWNRSVKIL